MPDVERNRLLAILAPPMPRPEAEALVDAVIDEAVEPTHAALRRAIQTCSTCHGNGVIPDGTGPVVGYMQTAMVVDGGTVPGTRDRVNLYRCPQCTSWRALLAQKAGPLAVQD